MCGCSSRAIRPVQTPPSWQPVAILATGGWLTDGAAVAVGSGGVGEAVTVGVGVGVGAVDVGVGVGVRVCDGTTPS